MAGTIVQAVMKSSSQSNGNRQISTPWGFETSERILMKLEIYNYVLGMTMHICKSMWCCDNVDRLDEHVTCHVVVSRSSCTKHIGGCAVFSSLGPWVNYQLFWKISGRKLCKIDT